MNKSEEKLYELVINEISSGSIKRGLMAKALVIADGDEKVAKARYIELRAEQIFEDIKLHGLSISELKAMRAEDMDHVSSDLFEGEPSVLLSPVKADLLSQRTGHLGHEIIDLIKMGILVGVRFNDDWYVDVAYISDW
jgi:hypothetical protein